MVNLPLVSLRTNPFSSQSRGFEPGSSVFKFPALTTENDYKMRIVAMIMMINDTMLITQMMMIMIVVVLIMTIIKTKTVTLVILLMIIIAIMTQ